MINLRLLTSDLAVDFARDGVDVAIRHGLGSYPGLRTVRVLAVELIPVAAPRLIARLGLPTAPSDLLTWPLVHDAAKQDWSMWFQALGISETPAVRGSSFDNEGLIILAAIAGQGAALVPAALASAELAGGNLVRLVHQTWPGNFAYYCVSPEEVGEKDKVAAFRNWLLEEAGASAKDLVRLSTITG